MDKLRIMSVFGTRPEAISASFRRWITLLRASGTRILKFPSVRWQFWRRRRRTFWPDPLALASSASPPHQRRTSVSRSEILARADSLRLSKMKSQGPHETWFHGEQAGEKRRDFPACAGNSGGTESRSVSLIAIELTPAMGRSCPLKGESLL